MTAGSTDAPSRFRYVAHPAASSALVDDETTACDLCGDLEEITYAGSQFAGNPGPAAICIACIEKGLPGELEHRRDGDLGALRDQLRRAHPEWTDAQVAADEVEKRRVLEKHTPPILSWQDWFWPSCCGDFCQFQQHAGQRDLHRLARDRNLPDGLALLVLALAKKQGSAKSVWSRLPEGQVSADSDDAAHAYVFTCRVCERPLILWDAC